MKTTNEQTQVERAHDRTFDGVLQNLVDIPFVASARSIAVRVRRTNSLTERVKALEERREVQRAALEEERPHLNLVSVSRCNPPEFFFYGRIGS